MPSMYVFCDRPQLRDWVVELAQNKGLRIASFGDGDVGDFVSIDEFSLRDDVYRVFLFPQSENPGSRLTLNDVKAREWGWVDVRPGGVRKGNSETVLLYSEIHGEKCERDQCNPDKWVQWLEKRLKVQVQIGVTGRNIVHGGESKYDNIWFTDRAKELFDDGMVWKQFVDGNVTFEPLEK